MFHGAVHLTLRPYGRSTIPVRVPAVVLARWPFTLATWQLTLSERVLAGSFFPISTPPIGWRDGPARFALAGARRRSLAGVLRRREAFTGDDHDSNLYATSRQEEARLRAEHDLLDLRRVLAVAARGRSGSADAAERGAAAFRPLLAALSGSGALDSARGPQAPQRASSRPNAALDLIRPLRSGSMGGLNARLLLSLGYRSDAAHVLAFGFTRSASRSKSPARMRTRTASCMRWDGSGTPNGSRVQFCSAWQVDTGTDVPRFITMYSR